MSESNKIPRKILWRMRYQAYRRKYGRWKAFWRGIVLGEVTFCFPRLMWLWEDECALMEHLVKVEQVSVELHIPGGEST